MKICRVADTKSTHVQFGDLTSVLFLDYDGGSYFETSLNDEPRIELEGALANPDFGKSIPTWRVTRKYSRYIVLSRPSLPFYISTETNFEGYRVFRLVLY